MYITECCFQHGGEYRRQNGIRMEDISIEHTLMHIISNVLAAWYSIRRTHKTKAKNNRKQIYLCVYRNKVCSVFTCFIRFDFFSLHSFGPSWNMKNIWTKHKTFWGSDGLFSSSFSSSFSSFILFLISLDWLSCFQCSNQLIYMIRYSRNRNQQVKLIHINLCVDREPWIFFFINFLFSISSLTTSLLEIRMRDTQNWY